jgi:signal transduction histidine kinase
MSGSLSLLIADDEDLVRRKVCMMLSDRFCVDQVDTARAVLEAEPRDYDAILLDIMFPDGNGIEICKEIKARDPHATVVISSSMETVDAWNAAFQAGADGYLEKRELLLLDRRKLALMIENLVERNRLRRQAEEVNRRQAQLLSVLSHDVRAPFQALLGTIDLLRGMKEIPACAADNIGTLHHCARDQLAFINSLLELLRLESGMATLRPMSVDINLPVHQSIQSMRILAEKKNILLQLTLQADLPRIRGDLGRLCHLVSNLVSNAIKFTPRGGKVEVSTSSAQKEESLGVLLAVADNGVGIRPDDRDKLFQRFHRGRELGTDGEKGTGLGLSICKEIVQLHGGSIEIDPERRQGTLVTAWFPADASLSTASSDGIASDRSSVLPRSGSGLGG